MIRLSREDRGHVPRPFLKHPTEMFLLRVSSSCPTCLGPLPGHSGGIISCSGRARVINVRARLSESSAVCLTGSPWRVWAAPGTELWLLLGDGVSVGIRAAW